MIRELFRYLAWEAWVYVMIAVDIGLSFFTWLLIVGLVPQDNVNFNVLGSLVLVAVMAAPSWFVSRYVRRLVG